MIEASTTFPLRRRYMYQPTKRAIGIVQAIVKVPHDEPGTSRRACSGSTRPGPLGFRSSRESLGTSSRNDS